MFVECEWLLVNEVRAQAQDSAIFDDMYKLFYLLYSLVLIHTFVAHWSSG